MAGIASSSGIWLASSKMTTSNRSGIERQRVRDAERAHQPDRLQILDDLAGVAGGQVANGFVAHRLAELVLQVAPPGGVGFLERLLLLAAVATPAARRR